MLVCNKNLSFECSRVEASNIGAIRCLKFNTLVAVAPGDVEVLFADGAFFFYDDVLKARLPDTDNTMLTALRVKHNADSTCRITIKLTQKGAVSYEN